MRWMGRDSSISHSIRCGSNRQGRLSAIGAQPHIRGDCPSTRGVERGKVGAAGLFLEERAQATVEAALLLPSFLTVLLLALQPVCLLYTRAVMESAAAETARLMITADGDAEESVRAFALRRLAAVPDVSMFHAGGPLSWDIDLVPADAKGIVTVSIEGAVTPLPVLGAFAQMLGSTDARGNVLLAVEVSYGGRPEWMEGDYEAWTEHWS